MREVRSAVGAGDGEVGHALLLTADEVRPAPVFTHDVRHFTDVVQDAGVGVREEQVIQAAGALGEALVKGWFWCRNAQAILIQGWLGGGRPRLGEERA
jgi:hypothetical protein